MNTSDNSNDENITTDYNNSEGNSLNIDSITSLQIQNNQIEESITNSDDDFSSNNQSNDPYTQLFIDNPDNPFYKCKIDTFDYETDDEETDKYIRIIVTWNFEYNYDFFNINKVSAFISKNESFKTTLKEVKNYRNTNSSNCTGTLLKVKNNDLKITDYVHIYLIVYYDNAKCNIEIYGIFDQEIEEDKLINNIINESIYGKIGKVISGTNINSTGGEGFIIIHNLIYIE